MPIKIAINGFGRIGRPTFKILLEKHPNVEVVVINDLAENESLAHLLKYDSSYGIYNKEVSANKDSIIVDGKEFRCLSEKDPENLPWQEMGVDVVLECTGFFTKKEAAQKHLKAGAKKVIISAPSKSADVVHFVPGVNGDIYDSEAHHIVSLASCTTNCLAPVAKVLNDNFGIETGMITTTHSYTGSQNLLDGPHKDLRRGRSAALSLVLTTTGAAIATTKVIPELEGKIDGRAIRVPTPVGSIVDFVAKTEKETDVESVNNALRKASQEKPLKGILSVSDESLVSVDYIGNPFSSIVDSEFTMVLNNNLVKIFAWYDNEFGYSSRLAEFAEFVAIKSEL